MPLAPAQPDALANTYAQALYDLASEQGGQDAAESTLGELEDILEAARADAAFAEFLSSRILPKPKREASLKAIFASKASDLTLRFLLVLNEKGRLSHLPPITASLDAIVQAAFGRVEVDVFTPAPIEPSQLDAIKAALSASLGKDVIVHPYTDPQMLGGVKLRVGDQLIDGSLASRLRRFRDQLSGPGAATLRAKADEIFDKNAQAEG